MIELLDAVGGLYGDPGWKPGDPGLYAVVIGVSRYPYLDGGVTPAANTLGFPQLATSAQTAYRVFRWLRETYDFATSPVVRCRVLLAPTASEETIAARDATDPKGGKALFEISGEPTMATCTKAIREWCAEMAALDATGAATSRALFFFSGHGIQVTRPALILPMDWLGDLGPPAARTISADNLVNGLRAVRVPQQWFFWDACRSTSFQLDRNDNMVGDPVLGETLGGSFDRSCPIVYAVGRGMTAYEPDDPEKGCTFFGASLLDGLYGKSPSVVACEPPPCRIEFDSLLRFVKTETARRLVEAKITGGGAKIGGEYDLDNPIVTVAPEPHALPNAVPDPSDRHFFLNAASEIATIHDQESFDDIAETRVAAHELEIDAHEEPIAPQHFDVVSVDPTADLHVRFGSERITAFLTAAVPPAAYSIVRRSMDARLVEATLDWSPGWLEWKDAYGDGTVFATRTPRDAYGVVVTTEADEDKRVITVAVDPKPRGMPSVQEVYRRYRQLDPADSAKQIAADFPTVIPAFREKTFDPLAALQASLILLRSRQYTALYGEREPAVPGEEDWLANLAAWFPQLGSDACVLLAQRLISDPNGKCSDRVAALVADIPTRGLPYTYEAMNYLLGIARFADVAEPTFAPRVKPIATLLPALREMVVGSRVLEILIETQGLYAVYSAGSRDGTLAILEHFKARNPPG